MISWCIDGLSNDTIYLANYYGAKLFYNDTAVTDANGTVTFSGKAFDEGGKYRGAARPQVFRIPDGG